MSLFDTFRRYVYGSTSQVAHADAGNNNNNEKPVNAAEEAVNKKKDTVRTKSHLDETKQGQVKHSAEDNDKNSRKSGKSPSVGAKNGDARTAEDPRRGSGSGEGVGKHSKLSANADGKNHKPSVHGSNSQSEKKDKRQEYRECDGIKSVPVDKHLPDIDQDELEPMQSVVPECLNLKMKYEECFNRWFAQEFLNGNTNMKPCAALFKEYSSCVKKGLETQNFELYPHLSLIPPDPDVRKAPAPRTKPPPGAEVHRDREQEHSRR